MLGVPAHLGEASLDPAPCRRASAVQRFKQPQQLGVDITELRAGVPGEKGEVPFYRSDACRLEIDPAQPRPREQAIVVVRLPVESLVVQRLAGELAEEIVERIPQERPVERRQRRSPSIIGKRGSSALHADPEARQAHVTERQRLVDRT